MWRSEVNDAVIEQLSPKPGEHVVDIGAGMGAGTVRAAARRAHVTAVEPTPFMRAILKLRCFFQRARKQITVSTGTAEHLPVADESIDALWAVNTMHHWVDAEAGAAEIARVLKPGGRILLVDEDFEDPTHPDFERFGGRHDHGDDDHGFTMVDATAMGERFRQAGLVEIEAGKRTLADRPVIAVSASAG